MKGRTAGFVFKGNGSVPRIGSKGNGDVPMHKPIDARILRERRRERNERKVEDERTSGTGNSSVKRRIEETSHWEKAAQKIGRKNWREETRHERVY